MAKTIFGSPLHPHHPSNAAEALRYLRNAEFQLELPETMSAVQREALENCIRQHVALGYILEAEYPELTTSEHERVLTLPNLRDNFYRMAMVAKALLKLCESCTLQNIRRYNPGYHIDYENIYHFWVWLIRADIQSEFLRLVYTLEDAKSKASQADGASNLIDEWRQGKLPIVPEIGIVEGSQMMALMRTAQTLKAINPASPVQTSFEIYLKSLSKQNTQQRSDRGRIPVATRTKLKVVERGNHLSEIKKKACLPQLPDNFWNRHPVAFTAFQEKLFD
ncbi:hypothetical protein LEP3755_36040 [Leptolyngbya sp. NIES-3755]|nr:hypothetical protein LEP3755_36040 [Leptolyngbya sp. NIES-3755]